MSVEYYKRLERGHVSGVSELVLEALAHALQLDEAERAHLFDLARAASPVAAKRPRPTKQRIRPVVQRILDQIVAPAIVSSTTADYLGRQRARPRALLARCSTAASSPPTARASPSWTPPPSTSTPTGIDVASELVAHLRSHAGRNPYDRGLPT